MSLLVHWVVLAIALWVAAYIVPGVHVAGWGPLLIGAAVLGVVNTVVRPVMTILTLPITVLTLGLFYLVVNGAAFGLAAAFVPGFDVSSWVAAILGALVTGIASWLVGAVLAPTASPRRS